MQKKDVIESGRTSNRNLKTSFKCGDCLHFRKQAHRTKDAVCESSGIRRFAIAPSCFTPDVTQVVMTSEMMAGLASMYQKFSAGQRRILMSMLAANPKRGQLAFGTKVYFRAAGRDYLSNYLSGFVLGYSSGGELLVSGEPDRNRRGNNYLATFVDRESVLTEEQYVKHRAALIEAGKDLDPDKPLLEFKTRDILEDYEPPTIDNAPKEWRAKKKKRKKRVTEVKIVG